ncbi:5-methyltetrahydropteroyltriglutamate--homocysteine S-methyltransferase [Rhodovulum adriaticum]|uniref:5-methyltetrahydropteroyltriglutamate--homocysteine S-methyltransferase n=1 Tax=Rhodovulum adriaticum TaxID=35804 RepID=A0A4R2NVG7_RHOAD|nr:5-methyltetrahydropteroyltriglutamate--homocysteine S-methyltransferase [Rhodovulum adriaticum]MBK1636432.1 5-methyltetrahydropteroyltriglutamate--homocysteine S-methyltransferase [Rhodovulum adriaticum]TCP25568.1 methionine synthase (B12-independent) [Rhodovulum adriaticum]
MIQSANLGFPRIGARRELKKAVEAYWKSDLSAEALEQTARNLRAHHWQAQQKAGIDIVPSNDFSFYDQMLDITAMLGAVPARFGHSGGPVGLDTYFAMARGTDDAPAMEMTKWFDTNYHFIVPELTDGMRFALSSAKPVDEFIEAKRLGIATRPVLIGPVTWLSLAKARGADLDPLDFLHAILPLYAQVLDGLGAAGAEWVQIDEPVLALDLSAKQKTALQVAYAALAEAGPRIMLASYFGALGDNAALAMALPVAGVHIDLVRAPEQLDTLLPLARDKVLSLGLIDGRNVWRTDLSRKLAQAKPALAALGPDRIQIAPSCSLLHVPVDLAQEEALDDELKSWLAFAVQKLGETQALARAMGEGRAAVATRMAASDKASAARRASARIHDAAVLARADAITPADLKRQRPYPERRKAQAARLNLPPFPTTTIGSFSQTAEVRKARAAHRRGALDAAAYDTFLKEETRACIAEQEALGLDMLVHGEFERNDMVEYFGEHLAGFAFTKFGWVQSYGSRCVKPPLIYGDVSRPAPMTVDWSEPPRVYRRVKHSKDEPYDEAEIHPRLSVRTA